MPAGDTPTTTAMPPRWVDSTVIGEKLADEDAEEQFIKDVEEAKSAAFRPARSAREHRPTRELFAGGEQRGNVLRPVFAVAVHNDDGVATRELETRQRCHRLTKTPAKLQQLYPRIFGSMLEKNFFRSIRGRIQTENHFILFSNRTKDL